MLLVIDAGNTNIVFAVHDSSGHASSGRDTPGRDPSGWRGVWRSDDHLSHSDDHLTYRDCIWYVLLHSLRRLDLCSAVSGDAAI